MLASAPKHCGKNGRRTERRVTGRKAPDTPCSSRSMGLAPPDGVTTVGPSLSGSEVSMSCLQSRAGHGGVQMRACTSEGRIVSRHLYAPAVHALEKARRGMSTQIWLWQYAALRVSMTCERKGADHTRTFGTGT